MQARVLSPGESSPLVQLRGLGIRTLVSGEQTGGRFALLDHVLQPRALGAPRHTHAGEDEISYVLEGVVGIQLGDDVQVAGPGSVVFKPRGIPHTFWSAGDATAHFLELITPAGFESYFAEAAAVFATGGPPDSEALGALLARYRLDLDLGSVPELMTAHQLTG